MVSDELEGDIFVHHKEIEGKGFKKLSTGEDVFFEIIETDRGTEAQRVRRQQ
ncbi:MAG: cold shock domain-containing protein [Pseudomonadales bacterium]|nr:cold shock domain-containing protein [Pseudomonadales bacterium]